MNRQGYSPGSHIEGVKVLHAFADDAVEAEVLSMVGEVYRVTRSPKDNPLVTETRTATIGEDPFPEDLPHFDLGLLHPPCGDWSPANTRTGNPRENGNYIPAARRVGELHCSDYIIENRPEAPLHDPVVLKGGMFGQPNVHDRAFETTFPVDQPPERERFGTGVTWWRSYSRPLEYWKMVKGYRRDYRKDPLVKSSVPAPYLRYLLREWLETTDHLAADGEGVEA